jgi:hypothetical protein
MARTKQSGRKSTGGSAPRKHIKPAAEQKKIEQSAKKSGPSKTPKKLLSVRQKSRPRITPVSSDDEMDVSRPVSPELLRGEDEPVLDKEFGDPDVRLIFIHLIISLIY